MFIDEVFPTDCSDVGTVYYDVAGLAAGASQTLTITYDGFETAGSHVINATIDTNCEISETNESNNTYIITLVNSMGSGMYDSTHSAFTFTGNWSNLTTTGPYNGTLNYSATVGDYVTFSMSGSSFVLYYTQYTNRGNIEVVVDNIPLTTINTNGALVWQKTWTSPNMGAGEHTVKFVHASGTYIDIDAIQVIGP